MKILIGITVIMFALIGVLHIYWAWGGGWGLASVLPSKEDRDLAEIKQRATQNLVRTFIATLVVALLCFVAAALLFIQGELITTPYASSLTKWLCLGGAIVFALRAFGDRNYVGFFKKKKHTRFAKKDTAFYSPLCVWFSLIFLLAAIQ